MKLGAVIDGFKKFSKVGSDLPSFKNSIKTIDSGLSELDIAFKNAPTKLDKGIIKMGVNNKPLGGIISIVKSGDLSKLLKELGSSLIPSGNANKAFKTATKNFPEAKLTDMRTKITTNAKIHPDLNVKLTDVTDVNKLSKSSKAKLDGALKKIKAYAKGGLIVAGVVAVIAIGANMYKNIIDATNARNGCFLSTTINNKTTSCKITNRSCQSLEINEKACTETVDATINLAIYLQHLALKGDDVKKAEIEKEFNIIISPDTIAGILEGDVFEKISIKYALKGLTVPKICMGTIPSITEPKCRCCDPSADPNSLGFADVTDLADNKTLICVATSNILDTIVDIGLNAGDNLLSGIFGDFDIKKVLIYIGIAVVAILLIGFAIKMFKK